MTKTTNFSRQQEARHCSNTFSIFQKCAAGTCVLLQLLWRARRGLARLATTGGFVTVVIVALLWSSSMIVVVVAVIVPADLARSE